MTTERTPEGLPVVQPSTLDILTRDNLKYSAENQELEQVYCIKESERFCRDNSILYDFLMERVSQALVSVAPEMLEGIGLEKLLKHVFRAGAETCYSALRIQAELDQLERSK